MIKLAGGFASFLTLSFLVACLQFPDTRAAKQEYCQDEKFSAQCDEDEVILMKSAVYGRIQMGRCVRANLGFLGCSKEALQFFDHACSGKRNCDVNINEPALKAMKPCSTEVTWHLEAEYECVRVASFSMLECRERHLSQVQSDSGYISTFYTSTDRNTAVAMGRELCPWRIRVKPGQTINITGLNVLPSAESSVDSFIGTCVEFAVVRESTKETRLIMCRGESRWRMVYASKGHEIELKFHTLMSGRGELQQQFVVKYEAVGCPNPSNLKYSTMKRNSTTMRIKCNTSEETWHLTCLGSQWEGAMGNCTPPSAVASIGWPLGVSGNYGFPYGLLVTVAIGVALGVFLGGVSLIVVTWHLKKRRQLKLLRLEASYRSEQTKDLLEGDTLKRDLYVAVDGDMLNSALMMQRPRGDRLASDPRGYVLTTDRHGSDCYQPSPTSLRYFCEASHFSDKR